MEKLKNNHQYCFKNTRRPPTTFGTRYARRRWSSSCAMFFQQHMLVVFMGAIFLLLTPSPFNTVRAQAVAGDLIKGTLSAVYYVTPDNNRLAFPDEATYFTWYGDFNSVKIVSDAEVAALPLSGLVTVRPGLKMLRVASDPKVYAVSHGGALRWIKTEEVARIIFGSDWEKKIVTIPDAFFSAYKQSIEVSGAGQYWWTKERDASPTIATDLDPLKAPDAVVSPAPETPPVSEPTPAPVIPQTIKKSVLLVLWDPQRPTHPAPDKTVLDRIVFGAVSPSVADYYKNESGGKVEIVKAGVVGWYGPDKDHTHYWLADDVTDPEKDGFSSGQVEKAAEALKKAAVDFDFAKYDTNNDKTLSIDELAVVLVVPQQNQTDYVRDVFSVEIPATAPLTLDGVTVGKIAEVYIGGALAEKPNFGTLTHAIARLVFNLSDVTPNSGDAFSVGGFSIMTNPRSDTRLDAPTRATLGWLAPTIVTTETSTQELVSSDTSHTALKVQRTDSAGVVNASEYFLIENRSHGVYDNALLDTGVAIWHISSGTVRLVRYDVTLPVNDGRALWQKHGLLFPISTGELKWFDGTASGVTLSSVGEPGPVMRFSLQITRPLPPTTE